jgi:oligosaccharide reducing-end xylanase
MNTKVQVCAVTAGVLLWAASGLVAQAPDTGPGKTAAGAPAAQPVFARPTPHTNAPQSKIERFPGDGTGAYTTHQYRNLFAEQGHTPAESRAKVEKAFQQLFHGDGQEERIYFETGANENGPLAYITDWANNDARSEGMSYGMMIAVELDKKREFDAIWNWAHTYMLITDPKNPSVGYFAWSMDTDGSPRSAGAAPDGEEYFVMSLYFAANRWGNGKGIYNYKAEADRILRGMRHHPVLTGTGPFRIHPEDEPYVRGNANWSSPNTRVMEAQMAARGAKMPNFHFGNMPQRPQSIGLMVDEDYTMIKFVPDLPGGTTDASYHLPAFYELWSRWGPEEDRAFWAKAADVSRDLFNRVTGPETGLTPDQANFDGTPGMGFNGRPSDFGYDSWRSVSNWSVDYSWWHKDTRETVLSDRIQKFLYKEGIDKFPDRYTLDGKPLSTRHSPGMVAAAAAGSLAASNSPEAKAFVDTLWKMPIPSGEQRYFDGMLYLMNMMHSSGNFTVIEPRGAKR